MQTCAVDSDDVDVTLFECVHWDASAEKQVYFRDTKQQKTSVYFGDTKQQKTSVYFRDTKQQKTSVYFGDTKQQKTSVYFGDTHTDVRLPFRHAVGRLWVLKAAPF